MNYNIDWQLITKKCLTSPKVECMPVSTTRDAIHHCRPRKKGGHNYSEQIAF